jgi:hypothetical protein
MEEYIMKTFNGTIDPKKATSGKQTWSLACLILADGQFKTDAGGVIRRPLKPQYKAARLARCFTSLDKRKGAVKPSAYVLTNRIIGAITNHDNFKTMGGYDKLRKGFETEGFKSEYFKELVNAMEAYQKEVNTE